MASLALFGAIGGIMVAVIGGSVGFGALPGASLPLALVVALMGAAVGGTTMVLLRLFGSAGVSLASILLLILGNASSGGVLPAAYLPSWLHPLSEVLPVGVGVRAMQGLSGFQNDGLTRALVILPLWVLGAVAVLYLKDVFRREAPSAAQNTAEPQYAVALPVEEVGADAEPARQAGPGGLSGLGGGGFDEAAQQRAAWFG
jgi:ABC-type multidrug transport system permease subunit